MPDVTPIPKETRPWSCPKNDDTCTRKVPCRSCLGRRSNRSGKRKQREGRKRIENATGVLAGKYSTQTGNEENWRLIVMCEAKSGKQVDPIATRFLLAEAQAEAKRAIGDNRPFTMLAMPTGWGSDGIMAFRLSALPAVIDAIIEALT